MSDTNPPTLTAVMLELKEIRALLENLNAKPKSAGNPYPPSASQAEIPQPSVSISLAEAESRCVHFGKNTGKPLRELSERSVEWYATDQAPRLDSSGKPYPPRREETDLKNAARVIYHTRKGTLAGGAQSNPKQAPKPAEQPQDEESVPF